MQYSKSAIPRNAGMVGQPGCLQALVTVRRNVVGGVQPARFVFRALEKQLNNLRGGARC
jgi:hypothetical protein